jgi:hypothetical protein
VIPLERGLSPGVQHPLLGHGIDLRGGDAGLHHLAKLRKNPCHELIHPPQLLDLRL